MELFHFRTTGDSLLRQYAHKRDGEILAGLSLRLCSTLRLVSWCFIISFDPSPDTCVLGFGLICTHSLDLRSRSDAFSVLFHRVSPDDARNSCSFCAFRSFWTRCFDEEKSRNEGMKNRELSQLVL